MLYIQREKLHLENKGITPNAQLPTANCQLPTANGKIRELKLENEVLLRQNPFLVKK